MRAILVLVLALATWCAALWLLIAPDFSQWHVSELAAVHAVPPVAAWGVWLFWRRRARRRADSAAAQREAAAEQERQTRLGEARALHAAELQRLTYGCDCRALALAQLRPVGGSTEALLPEGDAIRSSSAGAEAGSDPDGAILDHLRPAIGEALGAIYARCPAAAACPIFFSPPAECVGEAVVGCLREVRAEFAADLGGAARPEPDFNQVLFLPARDSAADSVIGLFEANPALPGAVVLAFDSPHWRGRMAGDDDRDAGDPAQGERKKWLGKPGQGVFALFVTNPQLPAMLAALPRSRDAHDALTPYWEKDPAVAGHQTFLAALSDDERDDLRQLPALARIHRAATTRFGAKPPRSMEFARGIEALIERAQIHAALIELPFDPAPGGAAAAQSAPGETASADCCWLVHNAGGIDRAGNRLAALGVALFKRGMDLDPIAAATNLPVKAGDLGQARGVALLALTVAKAASGGGAALCAEFHGDDGLSLFFAAAPEGRA